MPTINKKAAFILSEEGLEAERMLRLMAEDDSYNTESSYSTNSQLYPDNSRSFVDKHMDYLSTHPHANHRQYIANLRLMTRLR